MTTRRSYKCNDHKRQWSEKRKRSMGHFTSPPYDICGVIYLPVWGDTIEGCKGLINISGNISGLSGYLYSKTMYFIFNL